MTQRLNTWYMVFACYLCTQVYTSVEEFFNAQAKLKELGFSVNAEQSELIYKAGVAVEVR